MMRSLYSGVAGLKTHQTKMDVIGNNIANVNTVGYKSQSINFSELMYQTTQSASGPNAATGKAGTNAKQIGLGVKTAAISTAITHADNGGFLHHIAHLTCQVNIALSGHHIDFNL